ncbi:M23 family metallopeptidase [Pseudarthrobacter sulfonivorans]|uniref:M23 family metallopeptidase n=1 Tax=Pseudarthrobacter sulfonivorans TaxID=121292 RepID=UPI0021022DAC|nr:peptidoglycan DD-metalloendopeptidase family protein [Pseudarthrobacter sulfonivorans]
MGNHWGSGRDKKSPGACATAARALAAGAAIVAAAFALGMPAVPALQTGSAAAHTVTDQVGGSALNPAILTDGRSLVPFGRTLVRTIAKDGKAPLNVASAQLKRPPEGSLMAPLEALTASSPFGFRVSPITGQTGDFHLGQDFAAACGTRVYAADSGVVRAAGWHPWGGGNRVEIDHGNGLITTYNHLEAIAVRTGDSVQVGQVIARVGTTGWSTGCHLHFETILDGVHTNPLDWTLLPIHQVDTLADIPMISYEGKAADGATAQRWAIPVATDNSHTVLHGEDELPAPPAGTPSVPATGTATPTPTPSPSTTAPATGSATGSAPPTSSGTAPPTSTPSGTATPSGSPSGTATPTGSPTGTATPTGSPTGSAPPTSSGTAPATGTPSTGTTAPATGTAPPATTAPPPPATTAAPAPPPPATTAAPAPPPPATTAAPAPPPPATTAAPAPPPPATTPAPAPPPPATTAAPAPPPATTVAPAPATPAAPTPAAPTGTTTTPEPAPRKP